MSNTDNCGLDNQWPLMAWCGDLAGAKFTKTARKFLPLMRCACLRWEAATLTRALHVLHEARQNVPDRLANTSAHLAGGCKRVAGSFYICDGQL